MPALENVYLEDSWVLSISAQPGSLVLAVGEKYCYRRGILRFDRVTTLSWSGQGTPPAMDATGQPDFGSFDQFKVEGEKYRLSGDFGLITIESDPPVLELAE